MTQIEDLNIEFICDWNLALMLYEFQNLFFNYFKKNSNTERKENK
jgi:hypothetical protein